MVVAEGTESCMPGAGGPLSTRMPTAPLSPKGASCAGGGCNEEAAPACADPDLETAAGLVSSEVLSPSAASALAADGG